jgi:hypothetical protein
MAKPSNSSRVSSLLHLMKQHQVTRLKVGDIEIEMKLATILNETVLEPTIAPFSEPEPSYEEILFHSTTQLPEGDQ